MNPTAQTRLIPLDWMRGLVMIFMTLDHVSAIFNRERWSEDSYGMNSAGASMFVEDGNPIHFLMRWITHLCAPTFVFLAGTALALSVAKRKQRGDSNWAIDRHLFVRGVILILLEVWMSLSSLFPVLQVLYAIGASLLCMVILRRLPGRALVGLALLWMLAGEWFTASIGLQPVLQPGSPPMISAWAGLFFTNGIVVLPFDLPSVLWLASSEAFFALYPMVPWLAIMMLGWAFGQWLVVHRNDDDLGRRTSRWLAIWGTIAIGVFIVQRVIDGYGNFWLPRGSDTLWRWLQVSKYPPSLAFYCLELGLMALTMAAFFRFQRPAVKPNGPLCVFGQVALFFFIIHIHLMMLVRYFTTGFAGEPPLAVNGTLWGTLLALIVLYPICRAYRVLKKSRPKGILRFF